MKILITNDDGIRAAGVLPLVRWAQKLGEVVVAAPKTEQSAKSHSIEIHKPFEVKEIELAPGVRGYAVDSTPADCVRFAVLGLKEQFDLVISGINCGLNIGWDIMYSGTVSAVLEAGSLGLNAMAVSTDVPYYLEAAAHMDAMYGWLTRNKLFAHNPVYNVNIPAGGGKGFRLTRQGGNYYGTEYVREENDLYRPVSTKAYADSGNDTLDTDAVTHGFVSVMPLTLARMDSGTYKALKELEL